MLKALSVISPEVAVMNEEKLISTVTVFPDSPVTAIDEREREMVVDSLVCVPSVNSSVASSFTSSALVSV